MVERKLYRRFVAVLKNGNVAARRYIVKSLAVCGSVESDVHAHMYATKALPSLVKCLETDDGRMIGNTALLLSQSHKNANIVADVVARGVVEKLLRHATNDTMSEVVRHNCAVAIGKFCLAKPECLQQLRDLHGLEILHEVMKANKLV